MSVRRAWAVSRAHLRELSRRKVAILLLLGLPLAFYFAAFDDRIAISFATVGFGWSIAIIALFSTQSLSAITPRLALMGFRPAEFVIGRVVAIGAYALVLGGLLFAFLQMDDVVLSSGHLAASLGFAFVGAASAGLFVGAVTDREMEAMLTLIGLVSLTLVVQWDSLFAKLLPMYATDRHAWASVNDSLQAGEVPWRSTLPVAAVLGTIAVVATLIRVPRVERER